MANDPKKINCWLCGSEAHFFCNKNGYDLYKCGNCKLIFIYPPLKNPPDVYSKAYFSGAEAGFGYVDYDADKEPMVSTFNRYLDIISNLGFKKGKLLDIGAATGFFMGLTKARGFEVTGVELSNFATEMARNKGLNVVAGKLEDGKFPEGYFDVITMLDVVEHLTSPEEDLLEVKRILKKGGLLVINTPDASSLWARVLGKYWQLIIPPEHVNYFSPNNLSQYLKGLGFKVKVNTKIGKSFTLQYILKMLYKWQKMRIFLINLGLLSKISIPINLRDNFFMILEKNET